MQDQSWLLQMRSELQSLIQPSSPSPFLPILVPTIQRKRKHFDQTQMRIQKIEEGKRVTQKSYQTTSKVRMSTQAKTHRRKPREKAMSTPTRVEESGRERVRNQDRSWVCQIVEEPEWRWHWRAEVKGERSLKKRVCCISSLSTG